MPTNVFAQKLRQMKNTEVWCRTSFTLSGKKTDLDHRSAA